MSQDWPAKDTEGGGGPSLEGGIRPGQLKRENGQGKGTNAEESPAVAGMNSLGGGAWTSLCSGRHCSRRLGARRRGRKRLDSAGTKEVALEWIEGT